MNKDITISVKLQEQIQAFGQVPEKIKIDFLKAVSMNPKLKEASKESIILGLAYIRQQNLSLDKTDGEVSLIPYTIKKTGEIVAQVNIQWKGYRKEIMEDFLGVENFFATEVKKGDVNKWNKHTGEMLFKEQFTNQDFEAVQEREEKETIGFIGVIDVDKEMYGQDNFVWYMSKSTLASHAQTYSKTAKTKTVWYGEKTVAKAVYRKFKNKLLATDANNTKDLLKFDQAQVHSATEVEYIDNPSSKGKVKVK